MLKLKGAQQFRARVVGSVLSSRPVVISGIRELSEAPGVTDYEVSFVQLVDKLTNGTAVTINSTGTSVSVRPGFVTGGEVEHACVGRSIGYYLEGVMAMCLFAKRPVRLTLTGVTNDEVDMSVDVLKNVTTRLMCRFGLESPPYVDIVERGLRPRGCGKVVFTCPVARELRAVQLTDPGFVKKVRGVAYGVRVSPQFTNRMATTARGIFNELLPDVYINTDHIKSRELSKTSDPGYGALLFSESTTGCFHGAQRAAVRQSVLARAEQDQEGLTGARKAEHELFQAAHPGVELVSDPETLAQNASHQLLEEIARGGCVDTSHQQLVLLLMALCPEDVSKVRLGKLAPASVLFLRLLRDLFAVQFKLRPDEADGSILASCVGVGYKNLSRKVT